ncbi:MAG: hypothetical protein KAI57_02595 [Candidatus Pacebacteria bacterium]|nr:hypothetical protein [Candidatus Paceibacterota bacterium]
MKKRTKIILIFILAVFLTIATAYKRVEVFNKSELNNLSCGWPSQYISSGFEVSRRDPPYPWEGNCVGLISGEWGDSVDFDWKYFVFDIAFFYLLILAVYYCWKPDHEENIKGKT